MGTVEPILDDRHGMIRAFLAGTRSPDPKSGLGACIVNKDYQVVGEGCNDFPPGLEDMPWIDDMDDPNYKYNYVIFAIPSAIFNASETKGCTLYTKMYPSQECAKLIVLSGITRVVYFPREATKPHILEGMKLAESILKNAGIQTEECVLTSDQKEFLRKLTKHFKI